MKLRLRCICAGRMDFSNPPASSRFHVRLPSGLPETRRGPIPWCICYVVRRGALRIDSPLAPLPLILCGYMAPALKLQCAGLCAVWGGSENTRAFARVMMI